MKQYKNIQKQFSLVGIDFNQSKCSREKAKRSFLIYGLAITSSVIFLAFEAKTLDEFANNVYITSATVMVYIFYVILVIKSDKLFEFIAKGEKFIDQRSKNPKAKKIYDKTRRQIEKWSKIGHFIIGKLSPFFWIFPKALISYFRYFTTDLGNEAFELQLYFWFPFNWKNPIGYFVAASFEYIALLNLFMFVACVISFGISNFVFSMTMSIDVNNILNLLNDSAKTKDNRSQTMRHLADFVKCYSEQKQFFYDFMELWQPMFMMISIWSLVTMCGVMLLIQMEMVGHNSGVRYVIFLYAAYAFGTVFINCELCQRITDSFEQINHRIKAFDWYSYPHEMQKLMPIILLGTQKRVYFKFFGDISNLRVTFRKIVRRAYSYFMVIREFIQ